MRRKRARRSLRQITLDNISNRINNMFNGFDENMFKLDGRLIHIGRRFRGYNDNKKRTKTGSVLGTRGKSGFWSWFI